MAWRSLENHLNLNHNLRLFCLINPINNRGYAFGATTIARAGQTSAAVCAESS